jgi:hypothetical protein
MHCRAIFFVLATCLLIMPLSSCGGGDDAADQDETPDTQADGKEVAGSNDPSDSGETASESGDTAGEDESNGVEDDGSDIDLSEFFPKEHGLTPIESSVADLKFQLSPYTEEVDGKVRTKGTRRIYTSGVMHRHGPHTYFYEDGKKQSAGDYALDKKSGAWMFWHANGKKSKEGSYVDGFADGKWTTWYSSGKMMSEGNYRRTRHVGQWTYYNAAGEKITRDYTPKPDPEKAGSPTEASE